MKNEPVMEIANQLMNDCDNFEIKNLDNNRGRVDDLPEIELCSDYIKAHIKGEKDQFKDTIKRFNLGYATNDNNALYQLLISLDFSINEILLSGLVKKDNHGKYYDTFRNRLIIPIASVDGGFVSFCGRSINNSNPKYIQLSDTTLCKKNEQVFGLNIAKNNNSKLILCEGFIDVIKMHQVGFTNTISICGFEMSKTQLALINKYADQVLLLYDNDEFGQKMQKQVAQLFDKYSIKYTTPHFDNFDYNDSVDMVLTLLNKGHKKDEIL